MSSVHGTVQVASAQLVQEVPDEEPTEDKMDEGKDEGKEEKEETKEEAKAPEPTKKKRKYKKTPLEVESQVSRMTRQELNACLETEAQMANQDRVIRETNDMRNELEAYIYKMRDEVIGDS